MVTVEPMPHRIFEIDEILRVIVWHTGNTSEVTTVSLACCCKAFEEPALSLLWVSKSLNNLLSLLPSILTPTTELTARSTEEEWKRFRQYASWVWVLLVDLSPRYVTQEFALLNLIAQSSTDGSAQQATTTVFPKLRNLTWYGEPSSLVHLTLFVSPILTDLRVRITTQGETEHLPGEYTPLEVAINSTISPSNLRSLCLYTPLEANPGPELKRSVADLILRCGSTLADLEVEFDLPESVVLHLMSLPNLMIWRAAQPAPTKILSSPPRSAVPFAQMRYLALSTATPQSWLSFISSLVGAKSHPSVPHVPALSFGNLTHFDMDMPRRQTCIFSCTFLLADSDISLLADALPRLEWVWLGMPCHFNTCQTTFRSLHTLSTRCPLLKYLCTHINTTTLVQDIRSVLEEDNDRTETQGAGPLGPSVGKRSFPLEVRHAHSLPLEGNVGVDDLEVVAKGLFDISVTLDPNVTVLGPNCELWRKVYEGIKALHV